MLYKRLLSGVLNSVSVISISGVVLAAAFCNTTQAMEEEREGSSTPPITSVPQAVAPHGDLVTPALDLETARSAVQKVKCIFQAMQAREKDFATVSEAFIAKLTERGADSNNKLDIIDPFWFRKIGKCTNQRQAWEVKKVIIESATEQFQMRLTVSKNAIQGFQTFIDQCDECLDFQNEQTPQKLQDLLDLLLRSHLLGLKNVVDRYLSTNIDHYSHISLKMNEIDTYYTQDSRLQALAETYYIVDYIRPIRILIKLGLQPDTVDWSFAENLQKYTNGTLALAEPSAFLLDGYLYKKGLSTDFLRDLDALKFENSRTDTGGTAFSYFETTPLSPLEKEQATREYFTSYLAYRKRVDTHIKSLTEKDIANIIKSREFLETVLRKDSSFKLTPTIITTTTTTPQPPMTKTKKKNNRKKKSMLQQGQHQHIAHPQTKPVVNALQDVKTTTTTTTTTQPIEKIVQQEKTTHPTSSPIIASVQNTPMREESKTRSLTQPLQLNTAHHHIQRPLFKHEKEKTKEKSGNSINNNSRNILRELLNTTSSPFTIDYVKALNAMSKIGIQELPSTRKGDFRKLVRLDLNGTIIGKVFAYKPATSTLGYELMRIYCTFIEEQLKARTDINLN